MKPASQENRSRRANDCCRVPWVAKCQNWTSSGNDRSGELDINFWRAVKYRNRCAGVGQVKENETAIREAALASRTNAANGCFSLCSMASKGTKFVLTSDCSLAIRFSIQVCGWPIMDGNHQSRPLGAQSVSMAKGHRLLWQLVGWNSSLNCPGPRSQSD
jgi:hypothetical protein